MNRPVLTAVLAGLILVGLGGPACTETECATPDYSRAECRVLVENELARLRSSTGLELRFQDPKVADSADPDDRETWIAAGRVVERDGRLEARVAHMGEFALSVRETNNVAQSVEIELDNVHPRATLSLGPGLVELESNGLHRRIQADLVPGGVAWIRGGLDLAGACPTRVRFALLSDVQTNPTQFARIIERLGREAEFAEAAGELLVGAVFAGDLTESSHASEFRDFADLLEAAAVPFALTPGNHDIYASDQPHYNQMFGPGNYAFTSCGVHVTMLDTGSGAIADSVLARLPQLFGGDPDDEPVDLRVMAMHHPPYAALTGQGWSQEDLAAITLGEFAHQGGDIVVAGHGHMLREFPDVPVAGVSLRQFIVGTAGATQGAGQPIYGYVRLSVEGEEVEACFVEVAPPGALPHQNTGTSLAPCTEP